MTMDKQVKEIKIYSNRGEKSYLLINEIEPINKEGSSNSTVEHYSATFYLKIFDIEYKRKVTIDNLDIEKIIKYCEEYIPYHKTEKKEDLLIFARVDDYFILVINYNSKFEEIEIKQHSFILEYTKYSLKGVFYASGYNIEYNSEDAKAEDIPDEELPY